MNHRFAPKSMGKSALSGSKVAAHQFEPDGTILFAGENAESIFLIKSGWVRLYRVTDDDRTIVLGLLGPGEVFLQDDSSADREQFTAADALTACEVTEIPFDKVGSVLARSPENATRLLNAFRRRQTAAHDHIEEVLTKDTSRRLASILLELARAVGRPADQPGVVRLTRAVTHQSLANMIGSNRVTVTRKLIELQARSLVRSMGRNSLEIDVAALRDFLDGTTVLTDEAAA